MWKSEALSLVGNFLILWFSNLTFLLLSFISVHTTLNLGTEGGWSKLPYPRVTNGTSVRRTWCAGCHKEFSRQHKCDLKCIFARTGFTWNDETQAQAIPCQTQYCSKCIRAGPPFTTRLTNHKGLKFPKMDASIIPSFICEACQVRATVGRELQRDRKDIELLMLEWMRQLDILHTCWAKGTMWLYASKLRRVRQFEDRFQVEVLKTTTLLRPPTSSSIPLMWAQLHHSLDPGKSKDGHITFSTSRGMCSAGSLFYQMDAQIAFPGQEIREKKSV